MSSPRRFGCGSWVCCWLLVGAAMLLGRIDQAARADDPPGPVASGVVVDEAGAPVAGAMVESLSWPKVKPVPTDLQGRFRFDDRDNIKSPDWNSLLARSPDGRLAMAWVDAEEPEAVRLILKPARSVAIRVVDGQGRPVTGAEVVISAGLGLLARGESDGAGSWVVPVPADAADWKCFARKSRVGFDYAQAERARGSSESPFPVPERLTLTLDGTQAPLRIKAVGPGDRPLAGIGVGLWIITRSGREAMFNFSGFDDQGLTTGVDGVAVLDWLPERIEGGYAITTSSPSFQAVDHATFVKTSPADQQVQIQLVPNERIAGQVVDPAGQPVAGVAIQAEGQGGGSSSFRGRTTTDAAGRYHFDAMSESAYILTATAKDRAAPYQSGLVLRAGRPLDGVNFTLGPATRLHGQVTLGTDGKPAAGESIQVVIDKGSIPAELKRPDDRVYHAVTLTQSVETDDDGQYELFLGAGQYSIRGLTRVKPIEIVIPLANPPADLVRDFTKPRPNDGPFQLTVVDPAGKLVPRARIKGTYVSPNHSAYFTAQQANPTGTASFRRSLDLMILHAETPDRSLAGMTRFEADAVSGQVAIAPTATATGRLVDAAGQPQPGIQFTYGILIHQGPSTSSAFSWYFGGSSTTDSAGRFTCPGLVVGQSYDLSVLDDKSGRCPSAPNALKPTVPGPLAVGDVTLDLTPPRPYVPPTAAELTRDAFARSQQSALDARIRSLLGEAKREYTRPLVLFGSGDNPASIELFRLFNDRDDERDDTKPHPKTPADLRWEFELMSLDLAEPGNRQRAAEWGVDRSATAALVVLDDDGQPRATYPLRLGANHKLDSPALVAFLLAQKLATRAAEAMLATALERAKAEEKRVFLIFSASWCGPCRSLARFLDANKPLFDPSYVLVKLDISRDDGIKALRRRYPAGDQSGVPWFVILDPAGRPLGDSNAPAPPGEDSEVHANTNIGFPSDQAAIDHFVAMLRRSTPNLPPATLDAIRAKLTRQP